MMSLECCNYFNGDKLLWKYFVREADKKLAINKLGPYEHAPFTMHLYSNIDNHCTTEKAPAIMMVYSFYSGLCPESARLVGACLDLQ